MATTIEDLESSVDWIIKRYKDIDNEKNAKREKNKEVNTNLAYIVPIVVIIAGVAFSLGVVCASYI